ncbi:hypothetical protein MLP_40760 [Microlunatus phosphovorus NM-1]|uniref:Uncharacterized protein n=1 Tax=Microlunatus phosphovorus (strain ATCC 700054 / DSM 10555 / JCM 9379 / NBRC 101784 / NCIMB 13414 / VKM Ac-1990 / NM-1) TaxID=1032480 RepID=F5XR68_MICPN|nr:hypothetical protein MLP_40760 [Microlunatus phosphovorus NM-1]
MWNVVFLSFPEEEVTSSDLDLDALFAFAHGWLLVPGWSAVGFVAWGHGGVAAGQGFLDVEAGPGDTGAGRAAGRRWETPGEWAAS